MNTHKSHDDRRHSSLADSHVWRVLAWIGIAVQGVAAVVAWMNNYLGGFWIILAFLVGSIIFLWIEVLPNLLAFVAILAAVVNAGGWAWNWYDAVPWFDEFIHTYSPLAIMAVLMYWFWRAGWVSARPASGKWVLIAAGSGLALGVTWEILESFFLDLSIRDTIVDLVLDTIGASLGGWLSGWVIQQLGGARKAH